MDDRSGGGGASVGVKLRAGNRAMSATMPDRFLGLDGREADYGAARFAVLPIPYDATTSFSAGARDGPRAIVSASRQLEDYDVELAREAYRAGIATLDPLEPDARGPEAMQTRIYQAARKVVRDGKFLIGLGGEHSITSALVRAVCTKHKRLSVLQIDAHADLRDSYQSSPYSHACVMRRIHDLGVEAVGVGIRSYSRQEARFIRAANKKIIPARRCHETDAWISDIVQSLSQSVYVTIDIDAFDPASAPGTGTPEPGGLDWYQVTDLLAAVAHERQIVAADVVEVRPAPPSTVTEFLAARLVYRIIGLASAYLLAFRRRSN
jgi:agmatinase